MVGPSALRCQIVRSSRTVAFHRDPRKNENLYIAKRSIPQKTTLGIANIDLGAAPYPPQLEKSVQHSVYILSVSHASFFSLRRGV